ncbi:AI-2E family transporter [Candidatus Saccharibacteria bacterium]|nr:AI-2E family transporter [Candidatus Saccharibacteria bacterium]
MSKLIETDTRTFVKFWSIPLIIAIVIAILYQALTGLIIIGISIFLALALKPLVRKVNDFFTKHFGTEKKHQTTSAVLAYIIVVVIIGGIIAIIGPVVVTETSKFLKQAPEMIENNFGGWDGINNFGRSIGIADLHTEITNAVNNLSQSILNDFGNNFMASVSGIADISMKVVLVLVLTLLFLLEGPMLINMFWKSISTGEQNKKPILVAQRVLSKMANVISTYVSRQMIVAVMDGCASASIVFIISLFTNVSSSLAIPMGMITMIFYMIPMFGQFIGGTLVTLILASTNPLAGIIFAVIYILYAQIENNIIAPKVQGNALNLPAVFILCAIVIGMYMFGLLGAIIAIPIAGCIRVLIDEYPNIKTANRQSR